MCSSDLRLAEWNASARRVGALASVLNSFEERIVGERGTTIVLGDSPDENLHIQNPSVAQTTGISSSTIPISSSRQARRC